MKLRKPKKAKARRDGRIDAWNNPKTDKESTTKPGSLNPNKGSAFSGGRKNRKRR